MPEYPEPNYEAIEQDRIVEDDLGTVEGPVAVEEKPPVQEDYPEPNYEAIDRDRTSIDTPSVITSEEVSLDFRGVGVDMDKKQAVMLLRERQSFDDTIKAGANIVDTVKILKGFDSPALAKAQKLSRETGLSVMDALAKTPELQKDLQTQAILREVLRTEDKGGKKVWKNPVTVAMLNNDPSFLQIMKDDAGRMAHLESLYFAHKSGLPERLKHAWQVGIKSGVRGLVNVPKAFAEYDYAHRLEYLKANPDAVMTKDDGTTLTAAEYAEELTVDKKANALINVTDELLAEDWLQTHNEVRNEGVTQFLADATESLPAMAMSMVAGVVAGPATGAALMGGNILGSAYEEYKELGWDDAKAFEHALPNALGQGLLEYVSLGKLTKFLKGPKASIWGSLVEGGMVTLTEASTEAVQTVWENAIKEVGDANAPSFPEKLIEAAKTFDYAGVGNEAAYAGLIGGFLSGAGAVSVVGNEIQKRADYVKARKWFDDVMASSKEISVKSEAPEQVADALNSMAEVYGTDKDIRFTLDQVMEYFEGDEGAFFEFAKGIGLSPEEIVATGADIVIPVGTYATRVEGTEFDTRMRDQGSFEADGVTADNMAERQTALLEELDTLNTRIQELSQEAPNLDPRFREMQTRLASVENVSANEANGQVFILHSFAETMAKRTGKSYTEIVDLMSPALDQNAGVKDGVRGRTVFEDGGRSLVQLFQDANQSTFLHESAHLMTVTMDRMVEMGIADETLAKDVAAFDEYASSLRVAKTDKPVNENGDAQYSVYDGDKHTGYVRASSDEDASSAARDEKLARAWEAYLREGKAPNKKMHGMFEQFKQWLTSIYKTLSQLNVELSDDIRGVFDRMIASEQDIQAAEDFHNNVGNIVDLFEETNPDKKKIQKSQTRASRKSVSERVRALNKAAPTKEEFAAALKQASEEVPLLPAQQLLAALATDKLSVGEVEFYAGESAALDFHARKLAYKKGSTMGVQEAYMNFGFESPADMITTLLVTAPLDLAIQNRMVELLTAKEDAEMAVNDAGGAVVADKEYHDDLRMDVLEKEVRGLANLARRKEGIPRSSLELPTRGELKAAAVKILGEKTLQNAVRYDRFSGTEASLSRRAYEAAKKGDLEAALKYKKQEMANHALVLESIKVRQMRDKALKGFKAIKKDDKAKVKKIFGDYRAAALDILSRFNVFGKSYVPTEKDYASTQEVIKNIEDTGAVVVPDLVKSEGLADYKKLTVNEFQDLVTGVNIISTRGSNVVKMRRDGKSQTIDEKAEECLVPMRDKKAKTVKEKHTISRGLQDATREAVAEITHIDQDLVAIDGNVSFGPDGVVGPNEDMLYTLMQAKTDMLEGLDQFNREHLTPVLDGIAKIGDRLRKKFGKHVQTPTVRIPIAFQKDGVTHFTAEQVVTLLLNTGNMGNLTAIKEGFGMLDSEVDSLFELLEESELATLQAAWDAIDLLFPMVDNAFYKANGERLAKVEAEPREVKSADGKTVTMKGGYYPLAFDPRLNRKVNKLNSADIMRQESLAVFQGGKPKSGHTNQRIGGRYPVLLSIGVLSRHIQNSFRLAKMGEALNDMNKVINHPEYEAAYIDRMGVSRYEALQNWLKNIANPQSKAGNGFWERFLARTQSVAATSAFIINMKSALKQPLSLTSGATEIGWRGVAVGAWQMARNPVKAKAQVEKLSAFMRDRAGKVEAEITAALGGADIFKRSMTVNGVRYTAKDLREIAFLGIRMGDMAGAYPVWLGAYNKHLAQNNNDEKAAILYADRMVTKTQPVTDVMFKNQFQRGGADPTAAGKALRWFLAPFNGWTMRFGSRIREVHAARLSGEITNKQYATAAINEMLLPVLMTSLVGALAAGADDKEDDEGKWSDTVWDTVGYWASWAPVINRIPSGVRYGTHAAAVDMRVETPKNVLDFGRKAKKLTQGEGDYYDTLQSLGHMVGYEVGVPVNQVVKRVKEVSDILIGKEEE